jgi:predicted small secreted protein
MNRLFLSIAVAVVLLSGCNTVAGIGKDVQRAGEAVQGAAK